MVIINGPVRRQIGVNCGHNALGHGFRANATIGRALRLMIINIGGAKPHEITKATLGHPAQYTFCVGENEEESPWEPLHVEKGYRPEQSTVTLFGGHSPLQINDHASRSAEQLALSLGWSMAALWNHKNFPLFSDTVLVVCPEHAKTFAQDGWSKNDLRQFLYEKIRRRGEHAAHRKEGPRAADRRHAVPQVCQTREHYDYRRRRHGGAVFRRRARVGWGRCRE
jgi:hypothetical protein